MILTKLLTLSLLLISVVAVARSNQTIIYQSPSTSIPKTLVPKQTFQPSDSFVLVVPPQNLKTSQYNIPLARQSQFTVNQDAYYDDIFAQKDPRAFLADTSSKIKQKVSGISNMFGQINNVSNQMGNVVHSMGTIVGSAFSKEAKSGCPAYSLDALQNFFTDVDSNLDVISRKPVDLQRTDVMNVFGDLKRRLEDMRNELDAKEEELRNLASSMSQRYSF